MNERAAIALSERQKRILALTEARGFVTIERLTETFAVSAQTVRRDLIALAEAGLLQRFHGGAGPVAGAEALRLDHGAKRAVDPDDKRRVARAAAALVPDGAAVFLDVGTTCEMTARALARRGGVQVFTTSMRAALEFDPAWTEVRVIGGRVAGRDGSLCGEDAVLALAGLRLDVALVACSGIDVEGRAMDFDLGKIAVKRAAMRAAARSFLLATPSKFGRSARAEIAPLARFDRVIDGRDADEAGA